MCARRCLPNGYKIILDHNSLYSDVHIWKAGSENSDGLLQTTKPRTRAWQRHVVNEGFRNDPIQYPNVTRIKRLVEGCDDGNLLRSSLALS